MVSPKRRFSQIRPIALLFSGFLLFFLLLLSFYHALQFDTAQSALDSSERERLRLLGESVRTALSGRLEEMRQDGSALRAFASERKMKRILLIDSNGAVFADSDREMKEGEKAPSESPSSGWASALRGAATVDLLLDEAGGPIGSVWAPFEDAAASFRGAMRIVVPLSPREEPRAQSLRLFLEFFGILGSALFGYYVLRALLTPASPSKGKETGAETETGFVIDTFHQLVQQLKQKEQELARLKARAEERAENVESYNENILQSVTSGVLTFNRAEEITTFNRAAGVILGFPPDQALGKSYERVFGANPRLVSLLRGALEGKNEGIRQECEARRADGDSIWLGLNTSTLRDRERQVIGATVVFTDLTEMKALQEQMELKKRLTVMGEMSAWIAHEFRNYMGTILGFAKLLSKKFEREDPRQEMLQAITNELSAMERLITELLEYGRKTTVHPVPVALPALLKDLTAYYADSGAYPRVRWRAALDERLPEIPLDPVLIRQAFSNLIQNALEAMEGEGEIGIDCRSLHDGTVQVKISDTGPGIPKERLDKIFLPFFTTKEKGTGLGLALVHKIILAHNGQISVESAEGAGTAFTVGLAAPTNSSS